MLYISFDCKPSARLICQALLIHIVTFEISIVSPDYRLAYVERRRSFLFIGDLNPYFVFSANNAKQPRGFLHRMH